MTYFSALVSLADPDRLAAALDAFDANSAVKPYRQYLEADEIQEAEAAGRALLAEVPAREPARQAADDLVARLSANVGQDVQVETVDGVCAYYYMSTWNREAELDGWKIGGRWSRHFKPRCTGDRDLIHGEAPTGAGVAADAGSALAGWVAGGLKSALDIDGTRDEVGGLAAREWDAFDGQRKQHPPALGWSGFLARSIAEPDAYPITRARADYQAQPLVAALSLVRPFMAPCPIDQHGVGRDAYIQQERDRAIPGYALLTLEGEWVKPGDIGMFGTSSADEGSMAIYRDRVNAYVDALPDDTWLIVTECHA